MATMKIYQSEMGVKKPSVPQIGPTLSQPFELAIQAGASVSKLGKAIDDIRERRKETKYTNQARKAAKEILPLMYETFSSFRTSSDTGDVKDFFKQTDYKKFKKFVRFKDKRVKEKVKKLIFDEQIRLGGQLTTETTANFKAETIDRIDTDLFGFALDMSSPEPLVRALAEKKMLTYANSPEVSSKFTTAQLQKKKDDTYLKARKLQLKTQTKNNPIDVLEQADEIKKEFKNKAEVKEIIKNAKNYIVSKRQAFDLKEFTEKKKTQDQQIENFTNILLRFRNKDKSDYQATLPTLDDINDLEKLGHLNSSQADALYQIYLDPDKVSRSDVFEQVNLQLVVQDTVDEVDLLRRNVNLSSETIKELGVEDLASFNLLVDKFKGDPELFTDFKFYHNQLTTDLGKADGWGGDWDDSKKKEKKIRINGLKMFSHLVSKTGDVEGSYFKILSRLKKDDLPTIDTVIPPMNIGLENIKEAFTKDPINGFNNLRQQIVEIYKQDKDLTTFKHDLAQLDVLEDLMELRKSFVPEGQDQITFITKTD